MSCLAVTRINSNGFVKGTDCCKIFSEFHKCHALIAPGVEPFNPVNIIDNIVLKK
jgi:hypothetical protein